MRISQKRFRRTAVLLLASVLALAAAVSAAEENTEPEVIGPVPHFVHTERNTRYSERQYQTLGYPVFGIPFLDAAVAREVGRYTDHACKPEGGGCEEAGVFESVLEYGLSAPRKGLVSILFETWDFATGMRYGSYDAWACTYDLRGERQLTLHDLFPDWEASEGKLKALLEQAARETSEDPEFVLDGEPPVDGIYKERTSFALDPDGLLFVNSELPSTMWGSLSFILVKRGELHDAGLNTTWWEGAAGER